MVEDPGAIGGTKINRIKTGKQHGQEVHFMVGKKQAAEKRD